MEAGLSEEMRKIEEVDGLDRTRFRSELVPRYEPVVLRGLVRDWPAVKAAQASPAEAAAYLQRFDRGAPVEAFVGPPEIRGRFFYASDVASFNFERRQGRLGDILRFLLATPEDEKAPAVYVGSAAIPEILPGFAAENMMDLLEEALAVPRLWIGNASIVSTHFDESDNIACVVAGRRRFTLFPPEQVANLYVGPLDFTMAGQPASMVPLRDPDFERYPRFRDALAAARVAELEPGDAIYIPTLWWHNVEALDRFNILVNYWWRDVPADTGSAFEAMVHAILAVAALPDYQRAAWRAMYENYVFRPDGDPAAHLPPAQRGILAEPTPELRQRIRQFLLRVLSRS
ncbi:MAG: transcription factor jumonji jmjC domain protein [Alphaproteobacteria bacterium]|nr:transcription factor jumonji jmjC domain protein [Alphaproteobacteria bacterium]